jgi:hypothetical protein
MTQVVGDIERCQGIGADEVIVEPQFTTAAHSIDAYLDFVSEVAAAIIRDRSRTLIPA